MKKLTLLIAVVILLTGCEKEPSAPEKELLPPICEEEVMAETIEKEDMKETIPEPDVDKELSEGTIPETPPEPNIRLLDMKNSGRDIIVYGDLEYNEKIIVLENMLDAYKPNISLSVYSLDGSQGLIYNGKQEYFSACTIKIPWMLYLCKGIDEGKYNKNDILTYEERHYHGGSGKIRYNAYGSKYTVEELITLCLSISDNVAYKMLVEYVDRDDFYAYIDTLECPSLHVPSWSIWSSNSVVRDYNRIWQVVYKYFETDTDGAKVLKNACTNTRFNYGTKTLVGEEYSHKSGENYGNNCAFNDAGIVWAEEPYVYAVFTKSEGTNYDEKVVNEIMTIIHELF